MQNETLRYSVIIPCLNREDTISKTLDSVITQLYDNLEIIVIDGASTDSTLNIVNEYKDYLKTVISEPDNGLYDAMNKGIKLATGDIIGILNADDYYINDNVLGSVAEEFKQHTVDAVFADLEYFASDNPDKVVRYYSSKRFTPERLKYGWMPAHPTLFLKRSIYDRYGYYKTNYKIAADYEFMVRIFWKNSVPYSYINAPLIKMRTGGISSRRGVNTYILNKEVIKACKENGLYINWIYVLSKYPVKVAELFTNKQASA